MSVIKSNLLTRFLVRASAALLLIYSSATSAGFFNRDAQAAVIKSDSYKCNPKCVLVGADADAPNPSSSVGANTQQLRKTLSAPDDSVLHSRFKSDVDAVRSTDVMQLGLRKEQYLWQAVQASVSAYPSIRSAMASLSQQNSGMDVARAGYLPSVKAGINSGRHGNRGNGQVLSVNAEQMLYDFGKVGSSVSYAEASTERQFAQVLVVIDDVARQAAQAVVEVHRFQLQEVAAQRQIEALRDLLNVAKARVVAGASTQADPVQASSRLDAAQSTLLAIKTQLRQWRSKLKTLVREPIPERIDSLPADELKLAVSGISPQIKDVPQVQVAEFELIMAKSQLQRAKAQQLPTVSVSAGVEQNMGGMRGSQDDHDYNVTLNVTNSLFEGGALRAQERAARYGIDSAEENIQTMHLEYVDRWQSATEQIDGIEGRLPLLAERQKSIVETRRLYREQYLSLGTRTLLDLLNSEQEIFQAELEQQNALHDLLQARLEYLQVTGRMRDVFSLSSQLTAGSN